MYSICEYVCAFFATAGPEYFDDIHVHFYCYNHHNTMPRVTKKQKELGVKPKPKSKGKAPVAGSKFTGVSGGKGKGFKVGPSHAARNSYIGKGKCLAVY